MIRRPPRSTQSRSSAASDVYKRQALQERGYREVRRKPRLETRSSHLRPVDPDTTGARHHFGGPALLGDEAGRTGGYPYYRFLQRVHRSEEGMRAVQDEAVLPGECREMSKKLSTSSPTCQASRTSS